METNKFKRLFKLVEVHLSDVPLDHGFLHAIETFQYACMASATDDTLSCRQRLQIAAAALLHDVDDRKFFNSNNYIFAHSLLVLSGFSSADIDIIIEMINLVSTSANGNTVVADRWKLIPRDADRLEALGKVGIQRCHAYTVAQNRPIALATTPRVTTPEQLDALNIQERFERYVASGGKSPSMIDHFYDKLLSIGTLSSGNAYLQSLADSRTELMREWLFAWCSRNLVPVQVDTLDVDV